LSLMRMITSTLNRIWILNKQFLLMLFGIFWFQNEKTVDLEEGYQCTRRLGINSERKKGFFDWWRRSRDFWPQTTVDRWQWSVGHKKFPYLALKRRYSVKARTLKKTKLISSPWVAQESRIPKYSIITVGNGIGCQQWVHLRITIL
jgi:hypothetical protein